MVRNSLRFVSWKNYKDITRDLKAVYQAPPEDAGLQALEAFASAWDSRYPQISRSWQANRANLATFFAYPADILKMIYTTNTIESLNSVIRNAIKKRKVFPSDDSVKKVVFAGHPGSITEMNDAVEGLANGHEPLYYRVRLASGRSLLRKGIYTKF